MWGGWKRIYTETEQEGWTEAETGAETQVRRRPKRSRRARLTGQAEPVWSLPERGFKSVARGRPGTSREGKQVACCVETAAVTQMPAGPQAGVDGLLSCLSGSGLGSDASGPWLLAGPDTLASSRFRPLGLSLGLDNQLLHFQGRAPHPPIRTFRAPGLQRSLGRQHSGCQNKPPP